MYIDLQAKLQKDSPFINLFQPISRSIARKNVKELHAGRNPDAGIPPDGHEVRGSPISGGPHTSPSQS